MGINPDHKGYCTPMSKPTCTPRRKALAKRLKPGGDLYKGKKKQYGGVANPLAEFRKMNDARKEKVLKSYPDYREGGPYESFSIDDVQEPAQNIPALADSMKLREKGIHKNPRYAKSAIKSRIKNTKSGSLFGQPGLKKGTPEYKAIKKVFKDEKKKGTYSRKAYKQRFKNVK